MICSRLPSTLRMFSSSLCYHSFEEFSLTMLFYWSRRLLMTPLRSCLYFSASAMSLSCSDLSLSFWIEYTVGSDKSATVFDRKSTSKLSNVISLSWLRYLQGSGSSLMSLARLSMISLSNCLTVRHPSELLATIRLSTKLSATWVMTPALPFMGNSMKLFSCPSRRIWTLPSLVPARIYLLLSLYLRLTMVSLVLLISFRGRLVF
mmetsp:Transcript_1958/g.3876  ORF Transcript_1958/g.3876 Transcript_1958/m.3876 type:complete len:205 (-) Transcript_1958:1374-1988(-)